MVIIPEEAERLLTLLREMDPAPTHLLTYSAPVTRKMLVFNDMNYYSVPPSPEGWKAPMWLKIELGVFAGRLYFQFSDYEDLCKYLGAHERLHEVEDEEDYVDEFVGNDGYEAEHGADEKDDFDDDQLSEVSDSSSEAS